MALSSTNLGSAWTLPLVFLSLRDSPLIGFATRLDAAAAKLGRSNGRMCRMSVVGNEAYCEVSKDRNCAAHPDVRGKRVKLDGVIGIDVDGESPRAEWDYQD